MQSVREQIVRAFIEVAKAAVAPVPVIRQPAYSITDAREIVIVSVESDGATRRANDRSERVLTIRVEALSAAAADPFAAADDRVAKLHNAVMTSTALSSLTLKIEEKAVEYQSDYLETFLASIPARYEITYRTMTSDLTTQG
jgi:hypothetical protein